MDEPNYVQKSLTEMLPESELAEKLAARAWEIEAAGDSMLPVAESRKRWEAHKASRSQLYLHFLHSAGTFLAAARDLGMLKEA